MVVNVSMSIGAGALLTHQDAMNALSDNIANVNTVAFRRNIVNFEDVLSQTVSLGQAPANGQGGVNPMQFGYGATVASITGDFSQGPITNTGRPTDLAIDGQGFFIAKNAISDTASQTYYTRDGSCYWAPGDNPGSQVVYLTRSDGARVQGLIAQNGVFGALGTTVDSLQDVQMDQGAVSAGAATTAVSLGGNLNAAGAVGLQGGALRSDLLLANYVDAANFGAGNGGLIDGAGRLVTSANLQAGDTVWIGANGTTNIINQVIGGGVYELVQPLAPAPGGTVLNIPATGATLLADARTLDNRPLAASGQLTMNAQIGDHTATATFTNNGNTLANLATWMQAKLGLVDATIFNTARATFDTDKAHEFYINANVGEGNAVSLIQLTSGSDSFEFSTVDRAASGESGSTAIDAFDANGATHHINLTLAKIDGGVWRWYAESDENVAGNPAPRNVGTGTISFDQDGRFLGEGTPAARIALTLAGGLTLNIDPSFTTMTQFATPESQVSPASQDGYPTGTFESFSIDSTGTVSIRFSNEQILPVAQIVLATFPNPHGLERGGLNTYLYGGASSNAGDLQLQTPEEGSVGGSIQSGALEESNVTLGEEMVNLIVTQRGYQANARVITVGNEMTVTLIQLLQ